MGAWKTAVLRAACVAGVAGMCGCAVFHRQSNLGEVTVVNSPSEVGWTSTTWEAATTPKHRRALERAHPETVIGEVVDVSGFLQMGERGKARIPSGQQSVRNGQPIGVLTDGGRLYLVVPEEHDPRRDGKVSLRERFAELMGKRVQVSGMVTTYGDFRALFVRTLPPSEQ
jgi:hypothetical protein